MIVFVFVTLIFIAVFSFPICKKIYHKGLDIWFPDYFKSLVISGKVRSPETIHIMLCVVDHFEPGHGKVELNHARERVSAWVQKYPQMADKHEDADGYPPRHSWFYPPHYHESDHLKQIVGLCRSGYGEIELHLHHDHHSPFPESNGSLSKKIRDCLDEYGRFGVWGRYNGKIVYAFIHGNWALDNGAGGEFCGVNNELQILKDTGCYADFTFPAPNRATPKLVNKIYYAKDDPNAPKSYNTGKPVKVGGKPWGDLMIVQGPKGIRWKSRVKKFLPAIEAAEIDHTNLPTKKRVDFWIKNSIWIEDKTNWRFIKLHCHGAREIDHDSLIGVAADRMYTYFEENYNDGKSYVLHYVTAREMFNIIKATEASEIGNPNDYRDYLVKKPTYAYSEDSIADSE